MVAAAEMTTTLTKTATNRADADDRSWLISCPATQREGEMVATRASSAISRLLALAHNRGFRQGLMSDVTVGVT